MTRTLPSGTKARACVKFGRQRATLHLPRGRQPASHSRRDRQARLAWGTPSRAWQNSSSGHATPKTASVYAGALWRGARSVAGTHAETYLREPGFDEPPPRSGFCPIIAMGHGEILRLHDRRDASAHTRDRRGAIDVSRLGREAQYRCLKTRRTVGPVREGASRLGPRLAPSDISSSNFPARQSA